MGVAVSGWTLARAVAQEGQLGVVSGTALAIVLARRLQLGDPGGHMRRALAHFPIAGIAQRIIDQYFVPGGKPHDRPFKPLPMPAVQLKRELLELTVASNFVEVFLAKEGHDGVVGVNYLEKIQIATLPSLFGAMLAGVDYVLMGAGVPRAIPGVLDSLARGERVALKVDCIEPPGIEPSANEPIQCHFDPAAFCGGDAPPALKRPYFLAIVSSAVLASALARKSSGRVDGFVVEGPTAGGHNAPPRRAAPPSERGEPLRYSDADTPDLDRIRSLGLPFWLAGSYGDPAKLAAAIALGATGVQVGTAFAFCAEAGVTEELKRRVIDQAAAGNVDVVTDPFASPTGFPFKVVQLQGTLSDQQVYAARTRNCDLGYLRSVHRRADGSIGYRCPAAPQAQYVAQGGCIDDTHDRKCLCNGLLATVGLGQVQANGEVDPALVTAGADVSLIARFSKPDSRSYTAADVIRYLLGRERDEASSPEAQE
jgi:nitronate monooxygenase